MKKAFLLVGHESFGKSQTLLCLTGSRHSKYTSIDGVRFKAKHMSNDDIKRGLLVYVEKIIETRVRNDLIFCFCPNFRDYDRCSFEILNTVRQEYKIYFFVLMKRYGEQVYVTPEELSVLEQYGDVLPYNVSEEATDRAEAFRTYIRSNL